MYFRDSQGGGGYDGEDVWRAVRLVETMRSADQQRQTLNREKGTPKHSPVEGKATYCYPCGLLNCLIKIYIEQTITHQSRVQHTKLHVQSWQCYSCELT